MLIILQEPLSIALPPIMRSQVTRYVLRRLRALPGLAPPFSLTHRPVFRAYPVGCRIIRTPQRRTFLGLFRKPPRTLKEPEAEPGYQILLQYRVSEADNVRPPSRFALIKAWRQFFAHKAKYGRTVNSTQALCAHRVLLYLSQPGPGLPELSVKELRFARDYLTAPPEDDPTDHIILAKTLYTEIRRKALGIAGAAPVRRTVGELQVGYNERLGEVRDFYKLLAALAHFGQAREAKDLLVNYYNGWASETSMSMRSRKAWLPTLHGLAREGHEQDLLELLALARKAGLDFDPPVHGIMSAFFARRNNIRETKDWFGKQIHNNDSPSRNTYYEILQFAIRNNEKEWARGVYQDLINRLESGPWRQHKACWDTSFCWAVGLLGKGVDHVEHMFQVCLEKTRDLPNIKPDIVSINSLLRVAVDNNDPYLSERFMSLAEKMGFEPDVKTYMLQMEYRLNANDLDGAYITFQAMPHEETIESLPILNQFIRALCAAPQPDYERILEVTSHLEQRLATLEPQTVVSICTAFLKNDEHYEVIDTLSLHAAHYSIKEREMVRKAFVDYCLDRGNSTARVWDAYALLRQFFPEVEAEHRAAIMDGFFDRRRADMACHVFGHMRAHGSPAQRPTLETYVRFLEGVGRCPDAESLRTVHNMLKTDTTVAPNTLLCNGLMLAYAACGDADRALDAWREVTASAEGPSYNSLEIAFRAYEAAPSGDGPARDLWRKMLRLEIDVPPRVCAAYAGALAAHGNVAEARQLLDDMEDLVGQRPDLHA